MYRTIILMFLISFIFSSCETDSTKEEIGQLNTAKVTIGISTEHFRDTVVKFKAQTTNSGDTPNLSDYINQYVYLVYNWKTGEFLHRIVRNKNSADWTAPIEDNLPLGRWKVVVVGSVNPVSGALYSSSALHNVGISYNQSELEDTTQVIYTDTLGFNITQINSVYTDIINLNRLSGKLTIKPTDDSTTLSKIHRVHIFINNECMNYSFLNLWPYIDSTGVPQYPPPSGSRTISHNYYKNSNGNFNIFFYGFPNTTTYEGSTRKITITCFNSEGAVLSTKIINTANIFKNSTTILYGKIFTASASTQTPTTISPTWSDTVPINF